MIQSYVTWFESTSKRRSLAAKKIVQRSAWRSRESVRGRLPGSNVARARFAPGKNVDYDCF